ncbi:MAG: hypothetical protein ACRC41_12680 [Sarcina sp.]
MDKLELIEGESTNTPSEYALKEFASELRVLYEEYEFESNNLEEIRNE